MALDDRIAVLGPMLAAEQPSFTSPRKHRLPPPVRLRAAAGVEQGLAVTDAPPERARGARRERAEAPAQRLGQALERHHEAAVVGVALVAVEELVGALAALDDDRAAVAARAG